MKFSVNIPRKSNPSSKAKQLLSTAQGRHKTITPQGPLLREMKWGQWGQWDRNYATLVVCKETWAPKTTVFQSWKTLTVDLVGTVSLPGWESRSCAELLTPIYGAGRFPFSASTRLSSPWPSDWKKVQRKHAFPHYVVTLLACCKRTRHLRFFLSWGVAGIEAKWKSRSISRLLLPSNTIRCSRHSYFKKMKQRQRREVMHAYLRDAASIAIILTKN
jgi:hypothetical protein